MADVNLDGLDDDVVRRAESIADAMLDARNATKEMNNQLRANSQAMVGFAGIYSSITRSASKVAEIQRESTKSSKGLAAALKEQDKQTDNVRRLNEKINALYEAAKNTSGDARKNLLGQAQNLANARDNAKSLANEFQSIAKSAAGLNNSTKFFSAMSEFVSDIPGLRKLAGPFKDAEEAAKGVVLSTEGTAGSMKILSAGGRAFAKSIGAAAKSFLPLLIIKTIYNVLKFIVDLFISAQKNTVAIARNLGISRGQAEQLRQSFIKTADASGKVFVNSEKLIKAQSELVELLDRGGKFSENTLLAQTFLTSRLDMSADAAAKLTSKFEAFGGNADKGIDQIIDLNNSLTETGDSTATIGQLMKSVSQASGQIAASFGFSNIAIAKGVIQVRKFGLNLQQAKSISEGLLSFESSISNELEAELLTGRQLNFEKARMMALTGDIAGATEQVMSQMKGLTAEQRKSPIIMKSLAATIGLSVDELQDAYLLETDRTRQMEEQLKNQEEFKKRARLIRMDAIYDTAQKDEKLEQLRIELGLTKANRTELESTVTTQEAFKEAMDKAKDSLSKFTSSGMLDKLTDLLIDFVGRASDVGLGRAMLGFGKADLRTAKEKQADDKKVIEANPEQQRRMADGFKRTLAQRDEAGTLNEEALRKMSMHLNKTALRTALAEYQEEERASTTAKKLQVQDFTISTHPKDTLVMAGGTKLGGDNGKTETLLERLISAVEKGGNVYMNGHQVGETLALAGNKFK